MRKEDFIELKRGQTRQVLAVAWSGSIVRASGRSSNRAA